MNKVDPKPKQPITPLWIIASFVSLTETILGVAVIKTSGNIQLATTAFVILFPLLIAGAFFIILWNRPYVLYPPTEYGHDTDVVSYVQAMQQKALDENSLYSNIQKSIHSALTSKEVISELSLTLSPQVTHDTEAQITRVLNSAAEKVVEQIRESNFLTINSRPLLGDKDGKVWQVPYEHNQIAFHLINDIWHLLFPRPKPYTYGTSWALRDVKSGNIFKEIVIKPNTKDKRTLLEIGITSGMKLEVIRL